MNQNDNLAHKDLAQQIREGLAKNQCKVRIYVYGNVIELERDLAIVILNKLEMVL